MSASNDTFTGGCTCGRVRYQLNGRPLLVHCCHCTYCQRQTGSAFALNALFKADRVQMLAGTVNEIEVASPSGRGQIIARCPQCQIALWSNYYMGGIRKGVRFIRVGTTDNPDLLPPDVHIFTETKQSWVAFPGGAHVEDVFYDYETTWSNEDNNWRKEMLALASNG